jgi:hypothetical protein
MPDQQSAVAVDQFPENIKGNMLCTQNDFFILYIPKKLKLRYMKRVFFGLMALSLVIVSCKDEKKPSPSDAATAATQPEKEPTKEEMEKAWGAYMTPGAMHQSMAKMNGTWEGEITSYMDPSNPTKSKGTAVYKMILGGRYQESIHTSEMDMGGGRKMPFEGKSIVGYDNAKKVWVSTWVDNMGTGIMNMTGTYDEKTKTATYTGKCTNPVNGKDCEMKEVITFIDDNTQKFEMYEIKNGKDVKQMEIVSKRKM